MRDPLSRIQVRHKLPLTFAFLCLVAFGLGGYVVTTSAKESLTTQIRLRLNERATTLNLALDKSLELLGRRVEDFASDGFIRLELKMLNGALAEGRGAEASAVREKLASHLRENKLPLVAEFVDALLLDAGGEAVLRTLDSETPPADPPIGSEVSIGPLTGPGRDYPFPVFVLSTPVWSISGGERLGTLQIVVRADAWAAGLEKSLAFPGANGFTARLGGPMGYALPLVSGAEPEAAAGGGAAGGRHEERIRFSSTIARTGWKLDLSVHEGVLTVPINEMVGKFLYVGIALVLLTMFLVLFPRQFLLKPLSELQEVVRRFGAGDFSARVKSESGDEVGDLATGFNYMATAIEERTRSLQRTAEMLERREADIRFERDRLNAVIRSMEDGLFILDSDGRVSLANTAARPVIQALAETRAGKFRLQCANQGAGPGNCMQCITDFSNDVQGCLITIGQKTYEINGAVLPGRLEAIAGKVFVSRDVTVRVRQAEQEAHQERLSVLGEIAAVMAHELNNPLAAISMFSQMLMKGLDTGSPLRSHADVIHRNTESCKATIRSLLDMATTSASEPEELDVHELAMDVRQLLEPVAQRVGVSVSVEPGAGDPTAFGDELQLRQAMVNLVMNAIQAIRPGESGRVRLRTEDRGAEVAIIVADDGPGIPSEIRDHVFEPFFTTKAPGDGTGLGLPTSRRIVQSQGGRLALVETAPGRTVFEIVMPRRRVSRSGAQQEREAIRREVAARPAAPEAPERPS
jgi:signal transduction histidine kinase